MIITIIAVCTHFVNVISEATISSLIGPKFQKFPGRACSHAPRLGVLLHAINSTGFYPLRKKNSPPFLKDWLQAWYYVWLATVR